VLSPEDRSALETRLAARRQVEASSRARIKDIDEGIRLIAREVENHTRVIEGRGDPAQGAKPLTQQEREEMMASRDELQQAHDRLSEERAAALEMLSDHLADSDLMQKILDTNDELRRQGSDG
jgi:hypothetical protein